MKRSKPVQWMAAALTAAAFTAMTALTAAAEWQPSRVQQEVGGGSAAALRADGGKAEILITTEPVYAQDGTVVDTIASRQPFIKVTPVSHTMTANRNFNDWEENARLLYNEKAGRTTETGLTYAVNANTNLVYTAVTRADSTTTFLEKMNGTLRALFDQRVEEQNEAEETFTAEDYVPLSLFDITASAGALEEMGENGRIRLELEIPGVSPEGRYIVIHFFGELENPEGLQTALEQDFDRTVVDYDAELLEAVPGDGTLTIEMERFSPVLVMARVEPALAETPAPSPAPAETAEPEQSAAGYGWLWLLLLALAAVAAAVLLRKRKVTTEK